MDPLPMHDLSDLEKLYAKVTHRLTKEPEASMIPDVTRTTDSVDFRDCRRHGKALRIMV